ncbi:hypothetical protein [Litchfieldella xinjiangensis]|uniref:hypothetical protein n=1 Tax=Litchfieldella xinjiangensis TaxID=1166948 RepID=UPI0005B976E9|nr:hypothetical protein [Halomonas xinjiangensis]
MDSKYKTGLFRFILMLGAVVMALLASQADNRTVQALLWIGALWLLASATLHELSQRWPARAPWQLVPTLLLASLVWLEPLQFATWLWAYAILLMLPQPRWVVVLNVLLAISSWWQVQAHLSTEQGVLSALVLASLMLLGLARVQHYRPLWRGVSDRVRLIPGARLWTVSQLLDDIPRESARSDREGTYAELVLLRTRHRHCWALSQTLSEAIQPFEHCYRIDGRTLATLLTSRNREHARQRREALLAKLRHLHQSRVVPLDYPLTLAAECQALARQDAPVVIIEREVAHA